MRGRDQRKCLSRVPVGKSLYGQITIFSGWIHGNASERTDRAEAASITSRRAGAADSKSQGFHERLGCGDRSNRGWYRGNCLPCVQRLLCSRRGSQNEG